jgi:5'-3' exonuclease
MGVKLSGIPAAPVGPEDLRGKVVAIDAPNLLYAFYATPMLREGADRAAALRAATRGLVARIQDLHRAGARSVVVFDGPPHALKAELLVARDAARSVPAIGAEDYAAPRAAARALGVPTFDAPHDAEAQACWMARNGHADVVATTDWDALAMGAPLLLRNLSAHPSRTEGRAWSLVRAADALRHLDADEATLRCAVVLMGCDFFDGYDGLGPQRALKLARLAHGSLAAAVALLPPDEARHARAHAAHALLAHPPHRDCGTLRWGALDAEALTKAMQGIVAKPQARQTKLA